MIGESTACHACCSRQAQVGCKATVTGTGELANPRRALTASTSVRRVEPQVGDRRSSGRSFLLLSERLTVETALNSWAIP